MKKTRQKNEKILNIRWKGEIIAIVAKRNNESFCWRGAKLLNEKIGKQKFSHFMKTAKDATENCLTYLVKNHEVSLEDITLDQHIEPEKEIKIPKRKKPEEVIRFAESFADLFSSFDKKESIEQKETKIPDSIAIALKKELESTEAKEIIETINKKFPDKKERSKKKDKQPAKKQLKKVFIKKK